MKPLQMFSYSATYGNSKIEKQALGKSFEEVKEKLHKAGAKNIIEKY